MRHQLEGSGASRGMALGRARLEQPSRFLVDETPLEQSEVAGELQRLDNALPARATNCVACVTSWQDRWRARLRNSSMHTA